MKRLILAVLFLTSIVVFASSSRVVYLSNKGGVLATQEGTSYAGISGGNNFLSVDSNTVFYLDFTSTTTTETSVSGTGFTANTWNVTGTNAGSNRVITMGGIQKQKRVREFSGSSNYLQNSSSKIITSNYGTLTLEFILLFSDLSPSGEVCRFFGHTNATVDGIQCYLYNTTPYIAFENYISSTNNFNAGNLTFSSGSINKWIHFAMTFDSSTNTRKIAYRIESLITSMAVSGTGNDFMLSDSSSDDNYNDANLVNFLIGHGRGDMLGTADRGFDGEMSEARLSNVVRY